MKKIILFVILAAVCAAVQVYLYKSALRAGQGGVTAPLSPPVEVAVHTVATETLVQTRDLPGRTSAFQVAQIRPQVSGIILDRLFTEGSHVDKGQPLYQIDPAPYQAAHDAAVAGLFQARANEKAVAPKEQRYARLVKLGGVSQQQYDDAVAELALAQSGVAVAEARLTEAKINLNYTTVRSPISGRIGRSSVTRGALVTANQPAALAVVQDLSRIYVDVNQSGRQIMALGRQMASGEHEALLILDNSPWDTPLSDIPPDSHQSDFHQSDFHQSDPNQSDFHQSYARQLYAHKGELLFSDVTVDEGTGMVQLRILFPNPDRELLPGLFVRARLSQLRKNAAILIPQQALVRKADGTTFVWAVNEADKVNMRNITVSEAIGDKWLVTQGLAPGDRIVVQGLQKIRPGAKVAPVTMQTAGR